MTSTRDNARPASRWMGFLGIAFAAAPGLAYAQPVDLFFDRAVMTAVDERCELFAPGVSAALAAGKAQARGAALRAGASTDTLRSLERGAKAKAERAACNSSEVTREAERVRSAFEGFSHYTRANYKGDIAGWRADRNGGSRARWRLVQEASFGRNRMSFGLAGLENPGVLLAVGIFDDGVTPYSARLVMRDTDRTLGPYLSRRGNEPMWSISLDRRMPPGGALKSFIANARSPAGTDLLPRDAKSGWAFRFPGEAVREMSALDPREAVVVEFLVADVRHPIRRVYVEVGDFAVGQAFLMLAER